MIFRFNDECIGECKNIFSAIKGISALILALKVAVTKNLVAVKGLKVAVVFYRSGSEGLSGSGNPGPPHHLVSD